MGMLEIRRSSARLDMPGQFRMPELDNGSARAFAAQAEAAVKTREKAMPKDVEPYVRAAFRHQAKYTGEVPGATPVNCGNYLLHDLPMARIEAKAFLEREWKFDYPKARRTTAKGKVFFDA